MAGEPFETYVLLGGGNPAVFAPGALEPALRHIGIAPVGGESQRDKDSLFASEIWRIKFGQQQALAGPAADSLIDESLCHPETLWAGNTAVTTGIAHATTLLCQPVWDAAIDRVTASRELFKLSVLLIDAMGAQRFYWSPARLWSDATAFRQAVAEMLDSGMPPLLHLLAFQDMAGGGMVTRGLAFFSKQELHLAAGAGLDRKDAVRRLARLALDIMVHGPIHAPRSFPGLIAGENMRVGPATGAEGASILIVTITRE